MTEMFYSTPARANRNIYQDLASSQAFSVHFCQGVHVHTPSDLEHTILLYRESGDLATAVAGVRGEVRLPFQWLERWRVVVECQGVPVHEHVFDPRGKRVLISLGSSSLGDSLAWVPALEDFRLETGAQVIACSYHNEWFASRYPELEWVPPGTALRNLYACTEVGWYHHRCDVERPHPLLTPVDHRAEPLQATAYRQLGLAPRERRPRLALPIGPRPIAEPYLCLGIHATAQAKYWNNPRGWQEVTSWARARGYRAMLASREAAGHMGNAHPEGVDRLPDYELATTATWLAHAAAFVGVGSGLSWLAWALETPAVLVSGFSEPWTEPREGVVRVEAPQGVCRGCFNRRRLDPGNWHWCPDHAETPRAYECSARIAPETVIAALDRTLAAKYQQEAGHEAVPLAP